MVSLLARPSLLTVELNDVFLRFYGTLRGVMFVPLKETEFRFPVGTPSGREGLMAESFEMLA